MNVKRSIMVNFCIGQFLIGHIYLSYFWEKWFDCLDWDVHRTRKYAGVENSRIIWCDGDVREYVMGTIFLATDIINEKYGKEEARKAVWLGFYTLITMTIVMQFALLFQPHESDVAHEALSDIFSLVPQVAVGSLLAYIISQNIDVVIFAKLKSKFAGTKFLWIRNNLSTMISQLIDTTIFSVIAFWHFLTTDMSVWLSIFLSTYVIKFLVSALDTPFMYMAKKIHKS